MFLVGGANIYPSFFHCGSCSRSGRQLIRLHSTLPVPRHLQVKTFQSPREKGSEGLLNDRDRPCYGD